MSPAYAGGYFLHNEPLVRSGRHGHTAKDQSRLSSYTVEAVNLIQETPWAINHFVLDVVNTFIEMGEDVFTSDGETIVLRVAEPYDPFKDENHPASHRFTDDEWKALTPKQRGAWSRKRAKWRADLESQRGEFKATDRIVALANEMSEFDSFYFPHNIDFRTRIYPISTELTPQANDLSKGLLRFARGTRLGDRGLYWMAFTVGTHFGWDKLAPDERVAKVLDPAFSTKCEEWVNDPINNRGWLDADEPFEFLGSAYELVWALRSGDPSSFVSYLPGNLDGSCNGAQHLSIMSRDSVGAKATNCYSGLPRQDLYMEVGTRVIARVKAEAEQGNPLAIEILPKLEAGARNIVKRAVMTVPYGVTERGVTKFMINDGHVDQFEDQWTAAQYLQSHIWASIGETIAKGQELQRWFQACAIKCAEANKPLVWDTPAGSKVTQSYKVLVEKRIVTATHRFILYAEPGEGNEYLGMDVDKMGTSAPPNVVHSCDAAHLQITTCRMGDAGIKDFSMIHDSFGCPFAHMDLMRDILRQSIVDMYSGDFLQKWKASVEEYSGLEMPEPPEMGDFDVSEILTSEFFFS